MRIILTTTDFSKVAENAAHYACQLAVAQNAKLIVVNSFTFPVMFSDAPIPATFINDMEGDAESQMNRFVGNLRQTYPGLEIDGKIIEGDIISALEAYTSENTRPWLVVLGNSMAGDNATWPDSIVMSAFRHLKYPVLAIPQEASYKPVKKICFAFDNKHEGNETALMQLRNTALALNAELHVLHTEEDVLNRDNLPVTDEKAVSILGPASPKFHTFYEQNINDSIEIFNRNNDIDWLVLIPRKHSFFEGLFHKSQTKAIAHSSHIPVLALHEIRSE